MTLIEERVVEGVGVLMRLECEVGWNGREKRGVEKTVD
jgi:hypothetical protein